MAREIQHPEVSEEPRAGKKKATVERHPAYAQIGVSRVTGNAILYGSDFMHHNSIRIRIASSEVVRDISHDWYHADKQYIEVELSEAQWATMISSLNVGDGVPCTLRYRDGKSIPGLPEPKSRAEQFSGEARQTLAVVEEHLKALDAQIAASGLSAKKQKEMRDSLHMARMNLGSNLDFVAKSFSKHVETNVEKAKVEFNAYATNMIVRHGLEAIAGTGPISMIEHKKDEEG